jgi:hypothetical protein
MDRAALQTINVKILKIFIVFPINVTVLQAIFGKLQMECVLVLTAVLVGILILPMDTAIHFKIFATMVRQSQLI